jgi:hypothetical protein
VPTQEKATRGAFYIVLQWPRDVPAGPMTRYPFEFTSQEEAEEFRRVVETHHPDLKFAVQQLSKN